MAKHKIDGKGFASKGLRRSSRNAGKPVKLHAIITQQAERVGTAMREAFLNIKINASGDSALQRDVIQDILNSAKQNAGNNKTGRGWTANLSAATVRKLTHEGVFA